MLCEQKRDSYIKIIICNVLGYDEDFSVLNTLKKLRDVLSSDIEYLPLLIEYDVVGPTISDLIEIDYKKNKDDEMWVQIYNFYLSQIANFISEKNYEEAINIYKEMVSDLKEYFEFGNLNIEETLKYYDMSKYENGIVKTIGTI